MATKENKDQYGKTGSKLNSIRQQVDNPLTRRKFLQSSALGIAGAGLAQISCESQKSQENQKVDAPDIQGFESTQVDRDPYEGWNPVSDRKIRVGIVGYGRPMCRIGKSL